MKLMGVGDSVVSVTPGHKFGILREDWVFVLGRFDPFLESGEGVSYCSSSGCHADRYPPRWCGELEVQVRDDVSTEVVEHVSSHVYPINGDTTIEVDVGIVEVNETIHCSYVAELDRRGSRSGRVTIYIATCPKSLSKG